MQQQTKRLSLDAFKAKANAKESKDNLNKITGGILGACHDCYFYNGGTQMSCYSMSCSN